MVMLKNPELPATSKQLWLLHILTKSDTRNLKLTMLEASQQIESLKSGKSVKSVNSKPIENKPSKLMLGDIEITKAYKQISTHGKNGFSIHTYLFGIFPRGKKPHQLSWYAISSQDRVVINPLYGHIQSSVDVPISEMQSFIKSIKTIEHFKPMQVSDDIKPIAESKALELDTEMDLWYLINGQWTTELPNNKPTYQVDVDNMTCTDCAKFDKCEHVQSNGKCNEFSYNYCQDCQQDRVVCIGCFEFKHFLK